ncbi:MAG: hypothetical protein HZA93_21610 [Verrucomicrobia bacterium]|nr:hypothetical protein [Verrucomicrobiota bacterium]
MVFASGCSYFAITPPAPPKPAPPREPLPAGALLPSTNLLVGRVIAVDRAQGFAFVELSQSAPPAALAEGTPLLTRTDDLRETARLSASRYVRGRTLGARIVSGQPAPGNEVVWPTL